MSGREHGYHLQLEATPAPRTRVGLPLHGTAAAAPARQRHEARTPGSAPCSTSSAGSRCSWKTSARGWTRVSSPLEYSGLLDLYLVVSPTQLSANPSGWTRALVRHRRAVDVVPPLILAELEPLVFERRTCGASIPPRRTHAFVFKHWMSVLGKGFLRDSNIRVRAPDVVPPLLLVEPEEPRGALPVPHGLPRRVVGQAGEVGVRLQRAEHLAHAEPT
eukprot:CAMPEP_0119401802 /NCGR_PEP_ID=MMETSP1334-20130426/142558_1 /TAXON_ID=127549 /ORGANISM="Calcidiscus leptoporus, Strain RCC1130" /LENGTH=217 /DNA_ID=CAMNT_0007425725 /DNA_START=270 /DNA_END=922 /DNA_ORIENTATION=+